MRKIMAIMMLLLLGVTHAAQEDGPALPRVPRGFDEGREGVVAESKESLIEPGMLVERLFEQSDLHDLARFVTRHCDTADRRRIAEKLGIEGAPGAPEFIRQCEAGEVTRGALREALSDLMKEKEYSLTDVVAWLYSRGFNYRVLQRAMNGERIDSFKHRRQTRVLAGNDATARKLVASGLWEFNLDDAREQRGGHYDGVQLIETIYALGWSDEEIERALHVKGAPKLTENQRRLVAWRDPGLLWSVVGRRVAERDLIRSIAAHYSDAEDVQTVLDVAMLRCDVTDRWFRTGGPGVRGVYTGPWPDAQGNPSPPTGAVKEATGDVAVIAALLDEPVTTHFDGRDGDTVTLVVYDDGSARGVISRPKRGILKYGPDTPWGSRASHAQLYEGRVSLRGRNALLFAVYTGGQGVTPGKFELANVELHADGAFLAADIDDGLDLTPILLRRTTRLVEFD